MNGNLDANCHRSLSLTVNPHGDVFPCCSGMDQTRALAFGNIRDRSLADIVRTMERSAVLRQIVFEGIASLVPLIEGAGVDLGKDYSSICSLCWNIFSRDDCVAALRGHFPDESFTA